MLGRLRIQDQQKNQKEGHFVFRIDKLFSSALKRTLRASGSGVSIAAAACIQQKNTVQSNSASLLGKKIERKMHSKVVSEYYPSLRGMCGVNWRATGHE